MQNKAFSLLKKLSESCAISGNEEEIISLIKDEFKDSSFEVSQDNLGSVIVSLNKGKNLPTIGFVTHIDEVGFVVSNIRKDGFINFKPIGGWYKHIVPGSKVIVMNKNKEKFIGIIGSEAPHFLSKEDANKLLSFENMYLDLGRNYDEISSIIQIGDPIIPFSETFVLNNDLVCGKALDDRMCVTSLILAMKELEKKNLNVNVKAIFSVEEEVGCRGAKTSAYKENLDVCFTLDVTDSFDTPTSESYDCRLNNGVALSFIDGGTIAHRGLFEYLKKLFKKNKIKFTFDPMTVGGTDSSEIHKIKEGILNLTISLPVRYMHSFYSIGSMNDLESLKKVIVVISRSLNESEIQNIKDYKYQKLVKN